MSVTHPCLSLILALLVCTCGPSLRPKDSPTDDQEARALRLQLAELRLKMGEEHPEVVVLKEKLNQISQTDLVAKPLAVEETVEDPFTTSPSVATPSEMPGSASQKKRGPIWIEAARQTTQGINAIRRKLNQNMEVNFQGSKLSETLMALSEMSEIQIDYSPQHLGISSETEISIRADGSLREILRRILEPLGGTFVVHESCITICDVDSENAGALRVYDLSQGFSISLEEIIVTIKSAIAPDSWRENGGSSEMIISDNLLLVHAQEYQQHQIAVLLYRLSDEGKGQE